MLGRRPEHGSFIRVSPPDLTQNGWYCFVTNKTIKIFLSQSKFIEALQRQTPHGKKYSIGSPTFFECKMSRPSKRRQQFQCPCISSWNL